MTKNNDSVSNIGQGRALRRQVIAPKFELDGDSTFLIEGCGNTVTFVRTNFLPVETAATQAMQYAQQKRDNKIYLSADDLTARFPPLKNCGANPKDIKELVNSSPGFPDARKWTTAVFSRNLQMNPHTVLRYTRPTKNKKASRKR